MNEFLNELSYASETAKVLAQELREAKSLFSLGLDIKRFEATQRALLYFLMADDSARDEISAIAKNLKDKEVLKLVREFGDD